MVLLFVINFEASLQSAADAASRLFGSISAVSQQQHSITTALMQTWPWLTVPQVHGAFRDKPMYPVGKDLEVYLYEGALTTVVTMVSKVSNLQQQLCCSTAALCWLLSTLFSCSSAHVFAKQQQQQQQEKHRQQLVFGQG
jgi:hypothetical protein